MRDKKGMQKKRKMCRGSHTRNGMQREKHKCGVVVGQLGLGEVDERRTEIGGGKGFNPF